MSEQRHDVDLTDDQLRFIREAIDEKVSSTDIETQDRALEVLEQLPEPSGASW